MIYPALDAPQFSRQQITAAQFRERSARGLLSGCSASAQFGVVIVQMLRKLLDDGRFTRRLKLQVRQQLSDLFIPFTHVRPAPVSIADCGLWIVDF
jgi:hypothetical protein